ncbi:MAG: bifunctional glutamate N-acetyltransferase/amino-acid acetyltransferase ArgJ [Chloroflexota bacterium]
MKVEQSTTGAVGVTAARGFLAGGLSCGIKTREGAPDLALLVSEQPAMAAGVFTLNRAAAAPVLLCRAHVRDGHASAVVVNSGNANACTGQRGKNDALAMAAAAAARYQLSPENVLVLSTGVIGVPLPIERVLSGIEQVAPSAAGGPAFAAAIMTTDTREKEAGGSCVIGDAQVRIGGAAKGAGMMHPNMATLLSVITTDAAVEPAFLQAALGRAADASFNLISVDGDTSTNDSLVLLANGASGAPLLDAGHPEAPVFEQTLRAVCISLAKQVVRDGEGARTVIEARVVGARSEAEARLAARAVVSSALVKTAVFGGDPNWGRVLCAAGYSGADLDPDRATLFLEDICLLRWGEAQEYDRAAASRALVQPDVRLALDLGLGDGKAVAWGCDLSYEYVKINAEYTT